MFDRIMRFYSLGLWSKKMVMDALNKGIITESEFKQICGEE